MKKSDIAVRVARQALLSKAAAETAVNAVFEAVGYALAKGDKVTVSGFGTFATRSRPARTGRTDRGERGHRCVEDAVVQGRAGAPDKVAQGRARVMVRGLVLAAAPDAGGV